MKFWQKIEKFEENTEVNEGGIKTFYMIFQAK